MSIASASSIVKFHELPSGNLLHDYQSGAKTDGSIRSISWSKDGNWLALVPFSGLAEIISVKERLKLIYTIHGIEEPSCAAFQNTTKKNIAVGTKSGQVLIYDIKSRSVKKRFPRATSLVTKVEFTAKDSHVIAACESGEAFLFSNVQNSLSGTFKVPRSKSISAMRTSPIKRNYVVAGSNEGVVAVWDIHGNKNKYFIGSHNAPVTGVAFSPVSSDLVVSTGLDRQFCLHDIAGNKCIANIFVENSMTSVDFTPDGKFIVMGSQKGNIYIYDSKNIQQPLYSFSGHDSSVKHLLFRKSEEGETSFTVSSENVKESVTDLESHRSNQSIDIDIVTCDDPPKSAISQTSNREDSFLAAMGMDRDNTAGSIGRSSSLKEKSKQFSFHKFTPTNPSKLLQERLHSDAKAHLITSTPDCVANTNDVCDTPSPIANLIPIQADSVTKVFHPESFNELIKSTVKDELKIVSEEIKSEMAYHFSQVRQMSLSVLMQSVKGFIKLENTLDGIQVNNAGDGIPQNQALLEEIARLKQKIVVLEEEISMLKNN